jgi:hypothetical protein
MADGGDQLGRRGFGQAAGHVDDISFTVNASASDSAF